MLRCRASSYRASSEAALAAASSAVLRSNTSRFTTCANSSSINKTPVVIGALPFLLPSMRSSRYQYCAPKPHASQPVHNNINMPWSQQRFVHTHVHGSAHVAAGLPLCWSPQGPTFLSARCLRRAASWSAQRLQSQTHQECISLLVCVSCWQPRGGHSLANETHASPVDHLLLDRQQ